MALNMYVRFASPTYEKVRHSLFHFSKCYKCVRNDLTERFLSIYSDDLSITFRLDMCRRQYANDACNRGTAGRRVSKTYIPKSTPLVFHLVPHPPVHITSQWYHYPTVCEYLYPTRDTIFAPCE